MNNTQPTRPTQSGGFSKKDSQNLQNIRIILGIAGAAVGLMLLIMVNQPKEEVCVYYTDGTSSCTPAP